MLTFAATLLLIDVDDIAMDQRMFHLPGSGQCVAYIRVYNGVGGGTWVETFDVSGNVRIQYETVGGHSVGGKDHDRVEVIELPDGFAAIPMSVDLPDGDHVDICLMKHIAS